MAKIVVDSLWPKLVDRFSSRFQLRANAERPAAVAERTPSTFWRSDTSIDADLNS